MPASFNLLRHLRQTLSPGPGADRTDGELLEAFLATRDEVAFSVLMRRHVGMVFGVARRLLGPGPDAEDVFQTVFLVLVKKAASIRPRQNVGAWLHGVSVRVAQQARRQRDRLRRREQPMERGAEATKIDPVPSGDLAALLDAELLKLSVRYRALIIACDLQQRSRKEVAQQLGLAEGTVSSRLARARERLRRRLVRRGVMLPGVLLGPLVSESVAGAAPPGLLTHATLRLAGILIDNAGALGQVPGPVATLVKGALHAMVFSKFKSVGSVALVIAMLFGTAGTWTYRVLAKPGDEPGTAAAEKGGKPPAGDKQKAKADRTRVVEDNKVPKLLKERRDAVFQEHNARYTELLAGRGTQHLYIQAAVNLFNSELELAGNQRDRVAVCEGHVKRMKELHDIAAAMFNAGRMSTADASQAKFYLLDAEIALEREKAK